MYDFRDSDLRDFISPGSRHLSSMTGDPRQKAHDGLDGLVTRTDDHACENAGDSFPFVILPLSCRLCFHLALLSPLAASFSYRYTRGPSFSDLANRSRLIRYSRSPATIARISGAADARLTLSYVPPCHSSLPSPAAPSYVLLRLVQIITTHTPHNTHTRTHCPY